jgi:hypothetical protein
LHDPESFIRRVPYVHRVTVLPFRQEYMVYFLRVNQLIAIRKRVLANAGIIAVCLKLADRFGANWKGFEGAVE